MGYLITCYRPSIRLAVTVGSLNPLLPRLSDGPTLTLKMKTMRNLKKVQLEKTPGVLHVNSLVVSQVGSMFVDGTIDHLKKFYERLRSRGAHYIAKEKLYFSNQWRKMQRIDYRSSFAEDYVSVYGSQPYLYFGAYLSRPRGFPFVIRQPDAVSQFRTSRVGLYLCSQERLERPLKDDYGYTRSSRLTWEPIVTYRRFPSEWHPEMEAALQKHLK